MSATTRQLTTQIREAGYDLISVEQLRPNRWLLLLRPPQGDDLLALAQQRALVGAADVQDLAELLRLRHAPSGLLLALGGRFSPEAQRTAQELRTPRILLCTALPAPSAAPPVGALEAVRG